MKLYLSQRGWNNYIKSGSYVIVDELNLPEQPLCAIHSAYKGLKAALQDNDADISFSILLTALEKLVNEDNNASLRAKIMQEILDEMYEVKQRPYIAFEQELTNMSRIILMTAHLAGNVNIAYRMDSHDMTVSTTIGTDHIKCRSKNIDIVENTNQFYTTHNIHTNALYRSLNTPILEEDLSQAIQLITNVFSDAVCRGKLLLLEMNLTITDTDYIIDVLNPNNKLSLDYSDALGYDLTYRCKRINPSMPVE